MGKLFLSGGGDADQTQALDRRFAEEIDQNKPLLYIPIAMDASRFDSCFEWINKMLKPLGIENITMWTNVRNKSIQDLDAFSAVYIGGGNTFHLLKSLMDCHVIDILKSYAEKDGIIYGGSAGAIILGKNIMTCSHMDCNNAGLNHFSGLKLTEEYSIWCHYKQEHDTLIKRFMTTFQTPVIALPEETGIAVNGQEMQVIGVRPAYVFSDVNKSVVHENHFI
ncbi:Type 1 glutamine amidotransferase-like domain-containing protein [Bacillus swezeyi]|uniref:Type 1 glutamine amidotransferase-like domain-containing protein n=1 Tax=Bacillus swezeyi TaxID=1925020 RepID=UPI0027DDDA1F|nr:Type 1 glutamine amidotransferase-like domain-containing protein [Bacillus swezeyi]